MNISEYFMSPGECITNSAIICILGWMVKGNEFQLEIRSLLSVSGGYISCSHDLLSGATCVIGST